jgi:hypothetical protein
MRQQKSISINGMVLEPSPFVSTSYEYKTSGQYVIGGLLNVTLDGTLVGEDIVSQMNNIGSLQSNNNCVNLIIGCDGSSDFLEGAGRVVSVNLSSSDQPFVANYSIVVSLETVGGAPAVEPDPDFLTRNCLNKSDAEFISSYSENLEIDGQGEGIALVDDELGVSKSFIKGKGSISVVAFGREVCGRPSFNGIDQAVSIVEKRATALMSFSFCGNDDNPLQSYSGWNKWLDTKSLTINDAGSVEWTFDLYMSQGGCAPYAWVDINSDDTKNYSKENIFRKTRNISGTIRGLSSFTGNFLGNNAGNGERIANAERGLGTILPKVINGNWPEPPSEISGTKGQPPPPSSCPEDDDKFCYQRISSNITSSVVSGEITFAAEYADIDACKTKGDTEPEVTIEESLPVINYREFLVPNLRDSIVQEMGLTPHTATVTVRGALKGCDQRKIQKVIDCINRQFDLSARKYRGWLVKEETKSISTYSYSRSKSFVKCSG